MLEAIQRKIESAQDLYSVVKTMKALAAVNIHYHARAVEAITEYHQSIEMGFQALLKEKPEILKKPLLKNERRMGVIIFGSQRGMAGKFNVMVANSFMEWETDKTFDYAQLKIAVTGERVEEQLKEIGYQPAARIDFPESRYNLNSPIQELLVLVESWRFQEKIDDIYLFYNKLKRGVIFEPFQFHLFPLDQQWLEELALKKWPSRNFPLYTLPWEELLYSFIHQFFYISLYRAFIESMASENASRLTAMQKAEE
ncbi:MAG: F0F1 ATP synthase subunit gamma, partial [Thermoplasmata archaeon]|nr:F0F1 ATP synthase subunit gamma [Thermoplasmata archaeon]